MKLEATIVILAGLLAAAGSGAQKATDLFPAAPAATEPAAPTADVILERNLSALGGRERIHAVRTVRFEATEEARGTSVPMKVYWKRPDRLRIESPEEGLEKVQAFDGEHAWYTYPQLQGFGAEILDGAARDSLRSQADLVEGPTFDYAAKGNRIELLGKDSLAGGEAWRLQLTTAQGEVRSLWFDCVSWLQVREERTQHFGDREITIESSLSDFRPAGGILFAYRVESRVSVAERGGPKSAGEVSAFVIQKIELDVDLPDSLFALPLKAPPPSAPVSAPAPL